MRSWNYTCHPVDYPSLFKNKTITNKQTNIKKRVVIESGKV